MDWPERYCAALEERAGGPLGLTDVEVEAVLDLARDVAHSTERRFAPLSTYVTGKYVARRVAAGASATEALGEAAAIARELT
jgi:hypothetical protein